MEDSRKCPDCGLQAERPVILLDGVPHKICPQCGAVHRVCGSYAKCGLCAFGDRCWIHVNAASLADEIVGCVEHSKPRYYLGVNSAGCFTICDCRRAIPELPGQRYGFISRSNAQRVLNDLNSGKETPGSLRKE